MSGNSPTATPWHRYRDKRLAHARELQQLAAAYRDAPRCAKCWIVLDLRPNEPCHIVACPLASGASIVTPLKNAALTALTTTQ